MRLFGMVTRHRDRLAVAIGASLGALHLASSLFWGQACPASEQLRPLFPARVADTQRVGSSET